MEQVFEGVFPPREPEQEKPSFERYWTARFDANVFFYFKAVWFPTQRRFPRGRFNSTAGIPPSRCGVLGTNLFVAGVLLVEKS